MSRDLIPESTANYDFGPTVINGVSYPNALRITAQQSPQRLEIDAGRSRARFRGVLGVPDDGKSSASFQVDISLDNGPSIMSVVVNFGETKDIDLDVTNALRIKITVLSKTSDYGRVAIGNPRFA